MNVYAYTRLVLMLVEMIVERNHLRKSLAISIDKHDYNLEPEDRCLS